MNDNYVATVRLLLQFLVANAPAGAERELKRLAYMLEQPEPTTTYISMEFRPTDDTSCQMYVRLDGSLRERFSDRRLVDAEGNQWCSFKVKCEVSWPSWGSCDVGLAQRRLALMTEVARFAAEVEAAFPETFHRMYRTAAEVAEDKKQAELNHAKNTIAELVRKNAKGMKVGQTKRIEASLEDFVPVGLVEVERHEAGKTFKYRAEANATRAFYFERLA